jgi:hypothetical protein
VTATPYKAITWGDEPVVSTKLSQMTNNDQWIFENMPTMYYNGGGVVKSGALRTYAVRIGFPPLNNSVQNKDVYFSGRFSVGCTPVIAVGITGGVFSRKQTLIHGLNGRDLPDHTGCRLTVMMWEPTAYTNTFRTQCYVDLVAVGW